MITFRIPGIYDALSGSFVTSPAFESGQWTISINGISQNLETLPVAVSDGTPEVELHLSDDEFVLGALIVFTDSTGQWVGPEIIVSEDPPSLSNQVTILDAIASAIGAVDPFPRGHVVADGFGDPVCINYTVSKGDDFRASIAFTGIDLRQYTPDANMRVNVEPVAIAANAAGDSVVLSLSHQKTNSIAGGRYPWCLKLIDSDGRKVTRAKGTIHLTDCC